MNRGEPDNDTIRPVDAVTDGYPVSSAQRRLWLLERVGPPSSRYHIASVSRIVGPVNVDALAASLEGVARRHEALRTRFVEEDGVPFQVISPVVGASLGFLWFNAHPAEIFMGDVGSMSLGGSLGAAALMIKQEILLILVGGLFVMEALSVILQVLSYRVRGRRIFRMSPIHHHFELAGWSETKVVIRFWIISLIFALMALATLKLR